MKDENETRFLNSGKKGKISNIKSARLKILTLTTVVMLAAAGCSLAKPTVADKDILAFAMQQEHKIADEGDGIKGSGKDAETGNPKGEQGDSTKDGNSGKSTEPGLPGDATIPSVTPSALGTEPTATPEPPAGAGDGKTGNPYEHVSEDVAAFLSTLPVAQEGRWLTGDGGIDTYFYMQVDERWADQYYGGTDTIAKYACGPTSMSIIISSLTDIRIDPVQMSAWAKNNGYWFEKSGSLHSLIPNAAEQFGLKSEGIENTSQAAVKVKKALKDGKLVVALMGKGQFTQGGHFIVLRGLTEDGKVMVADPASEERTEQIWELSTIVGEAKTWAAAGGPFWVISR